MRNNGRAKDILRAARDQKTMQRFESLTADGVGEKVFFRHFMCFSISIYVKLKAPSSVLHHVWLTMHLFTFSLTAVAFMSVRACPEQKNANNSALAPTCPPPSLKQTHSEQFTEQNAKSKTQIISASNECLNEILMNPRRRFFLRINSSRVRHITR